MNPFEPVFYTPIYNDAEALSKSAEKMKYTPWKRIVIDGRFHGFEQINGSDLSTDDIKDVCKQYNMEYYAMAPCYEEQKFNFALQILSHDNHKIMALCSSDEWYTLMTEYTVNWLDHMCNGADYPMMFNVLIDEMHPGHKYSQSERVLPKIFYNLHKLENRHVHWCTYKKGTDEIVNAFPDAVPSVMLHHDNYMRPEERDDLMLTYQDKNIQRELTGLWALKRDRFYGGSRLNIHYVDKDKKTGVNNVSS
jgi:hypothetical protein